MQPNQAQPPPNYDFILNNPQKRRISFGLPSGNSQNQRIILVVAGLVLLLVAGIFFMSFLSRASRANTERLVGIAQQQQELIRVSAIGVKQGRGSAAKNLAITTELSLISSQKEVLDLLSKRGHKLGLKQLALKQKVANDNALESAALNNGFDEIFINLINEELAAYRNVVRSTYQASSSQSEKLILNDTFLGSGILIASSDNQKL